MSTSDDVKNWRNRKKRELVLYKGGQCEICGYDKIQYLRAFDFHHVNPNEKEFSISGISCSFEKIKKEVDKCQLLCCRCHMELHDKIEERKRNLRLNKKRFKKEEMTLRCVYCSNIFLTKDNRRKYCSHSCCCEHKKKVIWPTKEELKLLLKQNSYEKIGKNFGVSGNAVRKWAKKYELLK